MRNLILASTIFFTLFNMAFGQDQNFSKNPKVIEVEMHLTKEATAFLQQRLPSEQVYVNVEVDPLRRKNGDKSEQLPYFYSEDESADEWDAIDTPMIILLSRIKRANIKIEIPNTIGENETADLKEKLFQHLKLIPGRDSISVEKKAVVSKTFSSKDYTAYYFAAAIALFSIISMFFIMRYGLKSIPSSGSANANTASAAPATAAPMASMPKSSAPAKAFNASQIYNSKVNGDINFKDSIRAADLLKEKLHGVVNSPVFPLLSDMLILEELANKSLNSFGAFVFELPRKHQQKVFFRGRSEDWFKGYINAASVDLDCFLAVEKMLRTRTPTGSEKWEELIIQVWRLGNESHLFLKQIPQDDAFAILAHLPKSFSVPISKKTFPGNWARVLEQKEAFPMDDEAKIEDYIDRTLSLKPYFNFKSIDDYKKNLELVDYLRTALVKDEEDIYESLPMDSQIFQLRPPFYSVFKTEDETFKEILPQFELDEWALAILNSPRDYIKKINANLDDKKKYLFSNFLKQLDDNNLDLVLQSEIREKIGKAYHQHKLHQKLDNVKTLEPKNTTNEESENAKAA